MHHHRLEDMVKGWFVGDFAPTVLATQGCEVGVKTYRAGDSDPRHVHKVATEITLVLDGRVVMAGGEWGPGDIIHLPPGESTDFRALTDARLVVVKVPGAKNDKYLVE